MGADARGSLTDSGGDVDVWCAGGCRGAQFGSIGANGG